MALPFQLQKQIWFIRKMKLLEKIPLSDSEFEQFKSDADIHGRSWRQHAAWVIRTYLMTLKKSKGA